MKTTTKLFLSLLLLGSSVTCFAQKSDLKEGVNNIPEGRNILVQPHFKNKDRVKGIVAVDFTIDKKGNVISAHANDHGTNVKDKEWIRTCEEAVKEAKFSKLKKGSQTQSGTLNFSF
jgi:hypothetical protein